MLKQLEKFRIPRHQLSLINGSGDVDCDIVNGCMQTAFNNGDTFLIPICEEVLDPEHVCRNGRG